MTEEPRSLDPRPESHRAARSHIHLSIEVPGTPEEVWETIATGPGVSSWFVPMEVDGHVEGDAIMDFGSYGKETTKVTAWEPPKRVVFQSGGNRPLAYEWLVEAQDGGTCVVRLVNSGFGAGDDWDDQYDAMTHGWKIFLQSLRLQLTYFRGRRPHTFIPTVTVPGPHAAAWSTLCSRLGISDELAAGDALAVTAEGAPDLVGTVESLFVAPHAAIAYLLTLNSPVPGTGFIAAEGEGEKVACSTYLYLYDEGEDTEGKVRAVGENWTAWLHSQFPPLQAPPDG